MLSAAISPLTPCIIYNLLTFNLLILPRWYGAIKAKKIALIGDPETSPVIAVKIPVRM